MEPREDGGWISWEDYKAGSAGAVKSGECSPAGTSSNGGDMWHQAFYLRWWTEEELCAQLDRISERGGTNLMLLETSAADSSDGTYYATTIIAQMKEEGNSNE